MQFYMIKDFLISFKDNLREKNRNPFLGTYLLVWLFRNWELLFTLFNFDKEKKLQDKIDFIKNYYSKHDFLLNLWTNVYWAFGILVITYLLLNLSRLIVNLSESRLSPWIYKITDSKSIVLKSAYESIRSDRDDLQLRLDQERESKSKLEARIKSLETQIIEASTPKSEKADIKITSKSETQKKVINNEASLLLQKIKDRNLVKDFLDTASMINKGEYIDNDYQPKELFIQLGLLKFQRTHHAGNAKMYTITPVGESVLQKARLE